MNNDTNLSPTTITSWLAEAVNGLKDAKISSAQLDARLLLEHGLNKSHEWLLAHQDYILNVKELESLYKLVAQRLHHIPLAYIIGSKEFYGQMFLVTPDVLIPRPETEAMLDLLQNVIPAQAGTFKNNWILSQAENDNSNDINTIIDIGTGSGCLAISAKLLFPEVHVTAIDVSAEALAVARKNARHHNVQIQFKQRDINEGLPAMPKTRPYMFLANLPYVPVDMITSKEITKEPSEALFSGSDGLDHYRILWQQITKLKNQPSHIITESLTSQHTDLIKLAKAASYNLIATKDLIQHFQK